MYTPEIHNKPTPDQMFKLAAIAVCLAKDQGKLKESSQNNNAHIILPNELSSVEMHDDGDYTSQVSRFTGRVARVGYKQWSMRVVEQNWYTSADKEDGFRESYRFSWTSDYVSLNNRIIKPMTLQKEINPLEPYAHDFADSMTNMESLYAYQELSFVSEADCQKLIEDISSFSMSSNAITGQFVGKNSKSNQA